MRCLSILAVLPLTALVAAQQPAPAPVEISALIKQLGSDDYTKRESASKRLNAVGAPALAELCVATRSENPEVVRRAHELVRKIEYRIDNEKTLAPTLVSLDAKNERLDDVLAALSRQARCDVVLNGAKLRELADRRITVTTSGPFWDAVLAVCDAAGLKIAGAGGFYTAEALAFPGDTSKGVRATRYDNLAVVLEARGTASRPPAAVYGAVLVEVLPLPNAAPDTHSALLQIWPEPRLAWGTTNGVRVRSAIDANGGRLTCEPASVAPLAVLSNRPKRLIVVRQPDGGARFLKEGSTGLDSTLDFKPNARQAVVRFKPGETPTTALKELNLAVLGTVRSGLEPLSEITGLKLNAMPTGRGIANVEFTIRYGQAPDGKYAATATVIYDRASVTPAGPGIDLPGTKPGKAGTGNQSIHGVRITDADEKPFTLGLLAASIQPDRQGRETMTLTLELHPDKNGHGPPATASFWGSYARPVEVPVVLKAVPLSKPK